MSAKTTHTVYSLLTAVISRQPHTHTQAESEGDCKRQTGRASGPLRTPAVQCRRQHEECEREFALCCILTAELSRKLEVDEISTNRCWVSLGGARIATWPTAMQAVVSDSSDERFSDCLSETLSKALKDPAHLRTVLLYSAGSCAVTCTALFLFRGSKGFLFTEL